MFATTVTQKLIDNINYEKKIQINFLTQTWFNTSEQFIKQVENRVRKTTETTSKSLRMEGRTKPQLKASV